MYLLAKVVEIKFHLGIRIPLRIIGIVQNALAKGEQEKKNANADMKGKPIKVQVD